MVGICFIKNVAPAILGALTACQNKGPSYTVLEFLQHQHVIWTIYIPT